MTPTPPYDDAFCLLKISEGNEHFFNLVFEKYRDRIFSYLFNILKSREAAEEIAIDIFLRLWHGRQELTRIENLEAFLFRVAKNKSIDFFRALKRNRLLQQKVFAAISGIPKIADTDHRLQERETESVLQQAVRQLSPQRREVYYLRNEVGLSYTEIAKAMNLSPLTVRNHLAASVHFIRQFLLKKGMPVILLDLFLKKII